LFHAKPQAIKNPTLVKGQGKNEKLLVGDIRPVDPNSPVTVTHRIGGLLAYYHRQSQAPSEL
jgi:hypothetical protein